MVNVFLESPLVISFRERNSPFFLEKVMRLAERAAEAPSPMISNSKNSMLTKEGSLLCGGRSPPSPTDEV